MIKIAEWMKRVADICVGVGAEENLVNAEKELEGIREEVKKLALKFPVPGI